MASDRYLEALRLERSRFSRSGGPWLGGSLALLAALVAVWMALPTTLPSLAHEAYVWQRSWNEGVGAAVAEAGAELSGLLCLAAEVSVESGQPAIRRVAVDYDALRRSKGPVTAVVRIFPSVAASGWTREATEACDGLLAEVVAEWSRELSEGISLQIDYDCPERRLAAFHGQMVRWRSLFPEATLTFTALPTWLGRKEFAALARDFPDFVLQAHSLRLPGRGPGWVGLCDPGEARAAVHAAGRIGSPFRVALPTYSCLVVFDPAGGVAEVYAEDLPESLPVGALEAVALDSDASMLSGLVRQWDRARPRSMRGVVWYRLPAPGDRLNWDWTLLRRVVAGTPLSRQWSLRAEPDPAGFHRIVLRNEGNAPADLPTRIALRVPGASPVGCDGIDGWLGTGNQPGTGIAPAAEFQWHLLEPMRHFQKPAGWSGTVGWCRWQGGSRPPVFDPLTP